MMRLLCLLWLSSGLSAFGNLPLVTKGEAQATIVLPGKPTAVAKYAAEELAVHLQKATGVRLDIELEGAVRSAQLVKIYIGDCEASRQAGIRVDMLGPEHCVLQTSDHALYIAGDDSGGNPLDADKRAGTLWGVYEWLERTLQVRWLWPGELGTYVPKAESVSAAPLHETISPRFIQRRLRPGLDFTSEHPALGFTAGAAKEYQQHQSIFLRRHRMGRSYPFSYGHAFTDWWQKDGQKHPEWFQLNSNGKRGPIKKTGRFSMCVSNPELHKEIVTRWAAKYPTLPVTPRFINACENDILGLCTCAHCQAWDGPAPADYLTYYPASSKVTGSRFVSDRYARFWLAVQREAARVDPEANVVGYVYFNYFQAPVTGVQLNPRIVLGFCPSAGWFPRSDDEHAWMKRQWTEWRATGARLFMRTNHLLDGYCMPFLFARQFANEFHHAVKHGMMATDYDSLTGHWATQGPTLYVAARLHVKPEATADELLAEYYAAFGPASQTVKTYFDSWEEYTMSQRDHINQTMEALQTSRWRNWAKAAHAVYPESCFAPAAALLDRAAREVSAGSDAAKRVQFLSDGLTHARLCSRVASRLTLAKPLADKDETERLLIELMTLRRRLERTCISNFNHLAWLEDLSWKLSDETKSPPDLYP